MNHRAVLAGLLALGLPSAALAQQADVVLSWNKLVADGCNPPAIEDRLPISLKLLRNTPFAELGYRFKSAELATFFTKADQGSKDGVWYHPSKDEVKLEGKDLACAQKLRKLEAAERKKMPMPRALEVYLIDNVSGELVNELERTVLGQRGGSRVHVSRGKDGGWSLNFLDSMEHEGGDTTESSTVVNCDSKGENCRVALAG